MVPVAGSVPVATLNRSFLGLQQITLNFVYCNDAQTILRLHILPQARNRKRLIGGTVNPVYNDIRIPLGPIVIR